MTTTPGRPGTAPCTPPIVLAADHQQDQAVDLGQLADLARQVLEAEDARGELSLTLVDEEAMAELNRAFRGQEGATDVLAFPMDEMDEPWEAPPGEPGADESDEPPLMLGDVVICPAVAANNALRHGQSPEDEMALLVVHGILHLQGMDHQAQTQALIMEERERQLLGTWRGAEPSPGAPAH